MPDDKAPLLHHSNAPTLRVAMWSGPRNISTAMLRSWENRPDTWVTDEPLYSHYLMQTALPHPGAAEIIATYESDWRKVADWLTGPVPEGRRIWYQKHMAHHLLPNIGREWLAGLSHGFLIREPREMLTSLMKVIPRPTLEDTGLPQQVALFQWEWERTGSLPPVLDSRDVLDDPPGMMRRLCEVLGVPFTEAMLSWPAGPRPTDGIWAKYWYDAVERSTGFQPFTPKPDPVPGWMSDLHARCDELYQRLYRYRLRSETAES